MSKNARQNSSTKRKARLFFAVNVLVFFFLLIAVGREYVGHLQIQNELKRMETERAQLEQEQAATLSLIEELSSEYYLEKEGRQKHNLAKEGETLVIVQEDDPALVGESESDQPRLEVIPNYQRWFFYFFDRSRFDALQNV